MRPGRRATFRSALPLIAAAALLFSASGCSRRLGVNYVVNEQDIDQAASRGAPVGAAKVRLRGFSFYPGGGWAFRVERVQDRVMNPPYAARVDREERSLRWNFFFDGLLAKAWLGIPVGIVTGPWRAYRHADLHGLCENPVFDLVARLAGGHGRDGARYRHPYYAEQPPGYFVRLAHWTAWFNPFHAFGSWDYELESRSAEELRVEYARIEGREPLPCSAVDLIGSGGAIAARALGAGWWQVNIEDWLRVAAPGEPLLAVAYPTDLPGKAYSGDVMVHAPNRPPENAKFPLVLGDAIPRASASASALAAPTAAAGASPAFDSPPTVFADEFQSNNELETPEETP